MNQPLYSLTLKGVAALLLLFAATGPARCTETVSAVSTNVAAGIKAYEQNKYDWSVYYLHLALATEPRNKVARFYLANALQHLNQPLAAWNEYRTAIMVSSDRSTGRYARIAMEQVAETSTNANDTDNETAANSPEVSATAQRNSDQDEIERSLAQISAQAEVIGHQLTAQAEISARNSLFAGDHRQKLLREERARVASFIYNTTQNGTSQEQLALLKRYDIMVTEAHDFAVDAAARSKLGAENHAAQLKEHAEMMHSQMTVTSNLPGAVQLVAKNTNLYVRQYASVKPRVPQALPAELIADQNMLILDQHTIPSQKSFKIVPKQATTSGDNADLKVQGRLLHL